MYFNIIGVLCIEINARMAVSSSFLKVFAQAELEESIIPIIEGKYAIREIRYHSRCNRADYRWKGPGLRYGYYTFERPLSASRGDSC